MNQKPNTVDLEELLSSILKDVDPADLNAVNQKKAKLFYEASLQLHQAGFQGVDFSDEMAKLDALAAKFLSDGDDAASEHASYDGQRKSVNLTFDDGSHYKGELVDGTIDGKGTMTWPDGTSYSGCWRDGNSHGQGKRIQADGSILEGNFIAGDLNGEGHLITTNGTEYVGEWKDNLFHGQGVLTMASGEIKSGRFENGVYKQSEVASIWTGFAYIALGIMLAAIVFVGYLVVVPLFKDLPGYLQSAQRQIKTITNLGEVDVEDVRAELASLPKDAYVRSTASEPPADARKTSAVALTANEAGQAVISQIQNACGPNSSSTIMQTTVASTSSGHFAEAAYCCEGEAACQPKTLDSPTLEETLLLIEKTSYQLLGSELAARFPKWEWRSRGNGKFSEYTRNRNPERPETVYNEETKTFDIGDFDRMELLANKEQEASLRLYCRNGSECIQVWSNSTYSWGTEKNYKHELLLIGTGDIHPNARELLYKLKNAFKHLAALHGHTLAFKDSFYVENKFSGSD